MSLDHEVLPLWVRGLAQRMGPAQRRSLLSALAAVVRQGQAARIRAQQNPEGGPFVPRKPRHRPPIKTGPVFRSAPARLRTQVDAAAARIGWGGRVSQILRVHQEGLMDRVGARGPLYQYPARHLLGLTEEDRSQIEQRVIAHVSGV